MQSASFFNYRARVRYRAILCCFAVVVLTVQIALVPFAVSAQGANVGIDYNQIISDDELIDYQSMSEAEIQQFLEFKKSILATFYVTLDTGEPALLIVATDRISAFDYVLGSGIPDKGKVLTRNVMGPVAIGDILMLKETEMESSESYGRR